MTEQQQNFYHMVKASSRAFGFLGLLLGVTGGALTGVALKGIIGDPVVSGSGALMFYVAFGASTLITLYVMFNYVTMNLNLSGGVFEIRIGMKSATVKVSSITAVRVAEPKSRMSRVASQAKGARKISQMWSVLGVGTGVELDVAKEGNSQTQTWFISSNDPDDLAEKLGAVILAADDDSGDEPDSDSPVII
jgi:hypothetical protein